MQRRDIVINAVLVGIIVLLCYLIAVSTYEKPRASTGEVPKEGENTARVDETETQYVAPQDKYARFGQREVFRTIISRPTPMPTRTPRPRPTPSLERATHYWRLISAFGNEAIIEDTKLKKQYTLRLNESLTITYQNNALEITLIEVNENDYCVTVSYKDQKKRLCMF